MKYRTGKTRPHVTPHDHQPYLRSTFTKGDVQEQGQLNAAMGQTLLGKISLGSNEQLFLAKK